MGRCLSRPHPQQRTKLNGSSRGSRRALCFPGHTCQASDDRLAWSRAIPALGVHHFMSPGEGVTPFSLVCASKFPNVILIYRMPPWFQFTPVNFRVAPFLFPGMSLVSLCWIGGTQQMVQCKDPPGDCGHCLHDYVETQSREQFDPNTLSQKRKKETNKHWLITCSQNLQAYTHISFCDFILCVCCWGSNPGPHTCQTALSH